MATSPMFERAPLRAGMYESFYLRAVAPDEPLGAWIRYTVQKPPGRQPRGSIWFTLFDASASGPHQQKHMSDALTAPDGGWIELGKSAELGHGSFGPGRAEGTCGDASWSLTVGGVEPELRHLPRNWMYRAPVPRTKLTSPAPASRFDGVVCVGSEHEWKLEGWRGMIGHNWGAEHAERWIWLHGIDFQSAPDAWLDVALGRVSIAGRLTPWIANGAFSLDGRRWQISGLRGRGVHVAESPAGCSFRFPGEGGMSIEGRVEVPTGGAAGWYYGDPDGSGGHDVLNCSIAMLELSVTLPGAGSARSLRSAHGGVYELGMREHNHGIQIAPFGDD